jgi:hypothetical protein
MALFLASLVLVALAAPVFVLHYLTRLPEAPACPDCRRVTSDGGRQPRASGLDRLLALGSATPVRRCTSCGWEGRMRWRWAVQRTGEKDGRA